MFRPQRNKIRNIIFAAFFAVGSMFAQPKPAEALVVVCANCATEITMALQYLTAAKQLAQDAQSLYYLIKNYDLNVKSLLSIDVEPDPTLTKDIAKIRGFLARAKYFVASSQNGLKIVLKNDYKHPGARAELKTPWGPYIIANERYNSKKQRFSETRDYLYKEKKDEAEIAKGLDEQMKKIHAKCVKAAGKASGGESDPGTKIGMAQCEAAYAALEIAVTSDLAAAKRAAAVARLQEDLDDNQAYLDSMYTACMMRWGEQCEQFMKDSAGSSNASWSSADTFFLSSSGQK